MGDNAFGRGFQTAMRVLYPARCVACGMQVDDDFGLCPGCWRATPFITGHVCTLCGIDLPGEPMEQNAELCDACLHLARPWARGRAALSYHDAGRELVLKLKHADRSDIAKPAAAWMQRAYGMPIDPSFLLIPMPLHRKRLWKRRYNQAALLARALALRSGAEFGPQIIERHHATPRLKGFSYEERFALMSDAFRPKYQDKHLLAGKNVLLIDDVMTSGASLAALAETCSQAGAKHVEVLVLARATSAWQGARTKGDLE